MADASDVVIRIYDVQGRRLRSIDLGRVEAGDYTDREGAAYWDGRNDFGERVASGVYFYRLDTGTNSVVRRMVIAK